MRGGRSGAALGIALAGVLVLSACAPRPPAPAPPRPEWTEATFARKRIAAYTIDTPRRGTAADTVIGRVGSDRVRDGDTLLDIARWHDLGYNEIVAANPGLDPWVPPVGATVVLPTAWVLPCCTYRGIVVNIPEMRLYYYAPGPPGRTIVHTYPLGLGRDDRRTPAGRYRIADKTVDPTWVIPASIRREHVRERGDRRAAIRGGDPDNPLGRYRMRLSNPLYALHGTNVPWGVGRLVSHGCMRLYPEDIERLFPLVPVGTPVELTYQPVKVGRRGGVPYVEVHEDVYKRARSRWRSATGALTRTGLRGRVDTQRLRAALESASGLPVDVSEPGVPAVPTAGTPCYGTACAGSRLSSRRSPP
jgi:L,D-transpeptidase ErfK/SrfK